MNPYEPKEPHHREIFICEKCKEAQKPRQAWDEFVAAFVFMVILFLIVWLLGTALQLSDIRWVFINERTGETSEWESFPWRLKK